MRHIISYLFVVSTITSSLCNGIPAEISPQYAGGNEMVLMNGDTNDLVASNAQALKKISLSSAQSHAETVFVIGESAISNTTKDLESLSQEAQGQKLAEGRNLTALYSKMASSFSAIRIPIKLFKYEPQMPQLPGDLIPGLANNPNEPRQYYFEPELPIIPAIDNPWSSKESNQGVTVIWNQ